MIWYDLLYHLVCGLTPSHRVAVLLINNSFSPDKKEKRKERKQALQSLILYLFCTLDVPHLGNDTSSAGNLMFGAICLPPTLFSTKHTASDQYGTVLNGSFGLTPALKVTPASSGAVHWHSQFDLTWLSLCQKCIPLILLLHSHYFHLICLQLCFRSTAAPPTQPGTKGVLHKYVANIFSNFRCLWPCRQCPVVKKFTFENLRISFRPVGIWIASL